MDDKNQEGEVSPHKGELMVEDNDVDSEKSASLNDNEEENKVIEPPKTTEQRLHEKRSDMDYESVNESDEEFQFNKNKQKKPYARKYRTL